jgi:UDPglucose 6-dehydrogenase
MNVTIIGNGVVGNAFAISLRHAHDVETWDIKPELSTCKTTQQALECADLAFICLPTPQSQDIACDTSSIHNFFANIPNPLRFTNFVIRSTVPVGFTRELKERYCLPNLAHSPEFLTARTAEYDARNPTRLVIGYPVVDNDLWSSCGHKLQLLYSHTWPHVPLFQMTSDESEAVKLFQNAFSAVKVATFNEFRCFVDKLHMDWEVIMSALLAGGWINRMHTQVPGPDGQRGFGGTCLPKDLANLVSCLKQVGLNPHVTEAALKRNIEDRS